MRPALLRRAVLRRALSRRALAAAVTCAATLALAGCSGGSATAPAPASTDAAGASSPTAGPTAASPSSIPSPSPLATLPAETCLRGTYALVRFVAVGGKAYGTGQGGDVVLAFDDGRFTFTGAGQKPVVVNVGGQTGDLTVDGQTKGTYRLRGDTATFADTSATGRATLADSTGSQQQPLTMKQVAKVVGLAGDGTIACTDRAMTITLSSTRLELART